MVSSLAASAEVRLVFPTGGPAYVCIGCEEAFLRPGPRGERWLTAVKSGIVWDRAARDFEGRVKVRKCSCASGEDTNGVSLGYCHPCYKVHQPTPSKRASVCSSLLHPQVSTDRPATVVPGPKCLRLLWETCKAEREARLPWRRRHKVCPSCKWRAEQLAATSVGPATPPPAPPAAAAVAKSAGADGGPTIHDPAPADSCTPSRIKLSTVSVAGIGVDPASRGTEALLGAHPRRTRPESISVKFSNGVIRTYKRVVTATKAVVGPRQDRRRRNTAASLLSSLTTVDPAEVSAAVSAIARRASAKGGVGVAPLKSLSVRQQTQFKIANKISGVTWRRIRAFLGGRDSGLASLSALRADQVSFSLEAQNQVKTCDEGAYLVSPRAAIQALIDDLVERKEFLECPLGLSPTSASEDRCQPVHSPLAATTAGGGEPTGDSTSGGPGAGGICGGAAGGGQGLSGYAFRGEIEYGYTPMRCI